MKDYTKLTWLGLGVTVVNSQRLLNNLKMTKIKVYRLFGYNFVIYNSWL